MDMAALFADMSIAVSAEFGGPYHAGRVCTETAAVIDDGGSIVTPGTPVYRGCMVQVDAADQAMRSSDGYADGDRKFLILATSLDGSLDTDAEIEMLAGPFVGRWHVEAIGRDTFASHWVGRGRLK